jgi:hypothetical protein
LTLQLTLLLVLTSVCASKSYAQATPEATATPTPQATAIPTPQAVAAATPDTAGAANKVANVANQTATAADLTRLKVLEFTSEIKRRSAGGALSREALNNVARLTTLVRRIGDSDLAAEITTALANLTAEETKLEAAKTSLTAVTPQTDDTARAKQNINAASTAVTETKASLTKANAELIQALKAVYGYIAALSMRADTSLTPLKKTDVPAADLLTLLPRELPTLADTMRLTADLKKGWAGLSAALSEVYPQHATDVVRAEAALTALDASIASVLGLMEARMNSLTDYAALNSGNIASLIEQVKLQPAAKAEEARDRGREGTLITSGLDRVSATWDVLATQVANVGVPGFPADKAETARAAQQKMLKSARVLSTSVSTLQSSLAGDFSQFVTEKVRLYYFTDIPRLIKTLNDTAYRKGGDEAAQARLGEEAQRLMEAEAAFREADAEAAKFRARELALSRQLDDARADLNAANLLKQASTRTLAELRRRPQADVPPERLARAQEEEARREEDRSKAQQRFDELSDEQSGLPAKLREARQRRDAAQTEAERLSSRLLISAQTESAAFARARDNAPFWYAAPVASDPDPRKRVEITSSTSGENTLTLYGTKDDVAKVKQFIAILDEPAPQARMTLWKLELSSDASNSGTKKFNEALQIIEAELANTRAKIAGSLSLLLDTINEASNYEADARKNTVTNARTARYFLYSPQVLSELGVAGDLGGQINPKTLGLKDPAKATTLNEALLVLLLSRREARQNILYNFERRMSDRLEDVTTPLNKDEPATFQPRGKRWFTRLHNMLGDDLEHGKPRPSGSAPPNSSIELTRPQGELIYALRGKVLQRILSFLPEVQDSLDDYRRLRSKTLTDRDRLAFENAEDRLQKILGVFFEECNIPPQDILSGKYERIESDGSSINFIRADGRVTACSFKSTNARVAAADGLLNEFTKAFEDDLHREFIEPMLERLRAKLRSKGVGVGVIQRTSVLATNRLIARVDPRATAELELGEETNILQAVQQLAQLTMAAQTGGPLGVLGTFGAQQGDERPPEVYGLTTGNTFQVTPIFDPTGQALRFRFDFVGSTRIRDPNDTVNPRLPRIERHTVNTEVQLSNMEIREVSRFDSNARLGLPVRTAGGIPIIKDLPGMDRVPILGWFVRRTGKAAVTQQSIIFAQTTMSPTIGDILDLSDESRIQP